MSRPPLAQDLSLERECEREHEDVVIVLHAAVSNAEQHHRVKLLRDDRLSRIASDPWSRDV
jgi:hypothetical protein